MLLDPSNLMLFIVASAALSAAPGPDILFVLVQSSSRGALAGVLTTLGLCTGLIVHSSAAALGVSAVFQSSALAFSVLKYIGVGYLLYLAFKAIRSRNQADADQPQAVGEAGRKLYLRGIIMNITNPKVSLFFLAFLPQFTSPENGSIPMQMLILGALFIVVAFAVFSIAALAAGVIGKRLQGNSFFQRFGCWLTASIFVGLALKLAMTRR